MLSGVKSSRIYHKQGFVLATVLWLLAGLSLMASLMGDSTLNVAYRVSKLRERVNFLESAYSSQARMLIWLGSAQPRVVDYYNGIDHVQVNAVPYQIQPGSNVTLQDHAGLVQLNAVQRQRLANLLVTCGVKRERTDALIDALEDYTDVDHLSRINGAERDVYAQAKLPPPRNAPLLSEQEVWAVYGWALEKDTLQKAACQNSWSSQLKPGQLGAGTINISTAPAQVLLAVGLDSSQVKRLVDLRWDHDNLLALATIMGQETGNLDVFGLNGAGIASNKLLVTHRDINSNLILRYTIELQPMSEIRPWNLLQPVLTTGFGATNPGELMQTSARDSANNTLPVRSWPQGFGESATRDVQNKFPF